MAEYHVECRVCGKVFNLFYERRIGSLPVVESERLVGIVTERDLFRAIMKASPTPGHRRRAVSLVRRPGTHHDDAGRLIGAPSPDWRIGCARG